MIPPVGGWEKQTTKQTQSAPGPYVPASARPSSLQRPMAGPASHSRARPTHPAKSVAEGETPPSPRATALTDSPARLCSAPRQPRYQFHVVCWLRTRRPPKAGRPSCPNKGLRRGRRIFPYMPVYTYVTVMNCHFPLLFCVIMSRLCFRIDRRRVVWKNFHFSSTASRDYSLHYIERC